MICSPGYSEGNIYDAIVEANKVTVTADKTCTGVRISFHDFEVPGNFNNKKCKRDDYVRILQKPQ